MKSKRNCPLRRSDRHVMHSSPKTLHNLFSNIASWFSNTVSERLWLILWNEYANAPIFCYSEGARNCAEAVQFGS